MAQDKFHQRKESILSKVDKSSKGNWDKKIIELCRKINSLENYYTTSSCAGRIVLMIDRDKKEKNLFIEVYHDLISFKKIKKDLDDIIRNKKYKNMPIKFKQEPCILHVVCRTLKDSFELYNKAKLSGWKKSGLVSFDKNFVLELNSTEKLEFPIIEGNKILVEDIFLKVIVKDGNKKLRKSWEKIDKLRKLI